MERNYSIDFVKFFAIFFVVCIHTGTFIGVEIGSIHGDDIDFVIDTFARFAVPFFFVASGYLFVQKINSITNTRKQFAYFKKYTIKLTKLWLAWFVFFFLFDLIIQFIETEKTTQALKSMFMDYLASYYNWEILYYGAGHTQYHLWFLLALIWSVILLFIFVKIRLLPLLIVVSLCLNIYGLFGQSYSAFYEVTLDTRDALFFGLFYVALGGGFGAYAKQLRTVANRIPTIVYISLLIILSIVQIVEGYITLKIFEGSAQNYFIATIPLTILLFLTIIKHNQVGKNTLISKIGANAVGIYVSHVFIMEAIRILINRYNLTEIQETVFWKIAFTPFVFIIAYLFYAGLQRAKKVMLTPKEGKTYTKEKSRTLEYNQ
ncbi:acyltransferase [Virgibacillus ndiopensis]|uniref:acyltransferase n=1 Tax=Virgibacillus ndiopensis TaxID=2004408 RepID=UPI000C086D22|nr:acyltransferase [Virgibacillus ndiopensis]